MCRDQIESKKHPGECVDECFILSMDTTPIPEIDKFLEECVIYEYKKWPEENLWKFFHTTNNKVRNKFISALKEIREAYPDLLLRVSAHNDTDGSSLSLYTNRFHGIFGKYGNKIFEAGTKEFYEHIEEIETKFDEINDRYSVDSPGVKFTIFVH